MTLRLLVALALLWTAPQAAQPSADRFAALIAQIEKAATSADREAIRALGSEMNALSDFAITLTMPPPSRIVIKERDRTAVEGGAHRLLIEVFWERGTEGRLSTWTLDVVDDGGSLSIKAATRLVHVTGLYRLSLNKARQFDVRDLTVRGPDLALHLKSGSAFVADTYEGTTAVVLVGNGDMRFSPTDAAERTQVRIFGGQEALVTRFDAAFIRLRPEDFTERFSAASLVERAPNAADFRRASAVFDSYIGRTLQIKLGDLSQERWSITPQAGDMIVEVRTKRFGTLTYTRSHNDAEDVTLFQRARRRNISVYTSAEKLASRGRFYSEDDRVDYDILEYALDVAMDPDREQITGTARLKVRIRAPSVSTLNLRLAEELTVSGVTSPFGRLLHLRVTNQNTLIVSLPATMVSGSELWLAITYAGPLRAQELEREAVTVQQDLEPLQIPPEPRFVYSNRGYWYPQSVVTDYASSRLTITVPSTYDVIATGNPDDAAPRQPVAATAGERPNKVFTFVTDRPVRYLACVITRLRDLGSAPSTPPTSGSGTAMLRTLANARQASRARSMAPRAADIFGFYASVLHDAPYPTLALVFTERDVPGGHSPAYFVVIDQPMHGAAGWRTDPVNFDNYPDFFVAHEIAHQWWGQAIGWKNYHEQWISEGFAQYFAALYAQKKLARGVSENVFKRMRQTAIQQSSKGPVYLGYRLGHVQGDPRVFRSIVYNKAAMVLHMLRVTVGDEVFFTGLRDFYTTWKYRKAGTNDFQHAMEKASGRDLGAFFDAWVFGVGIPEVAFSHRTEGTRLVLRVEQHGTPAEFPVTVRLTYASRREEDHVVRAAGRITELTVELKERLRSVRANPDHGTLAHFR